MAKNNNETRANAAIDRAEDTDRTQMGAGIREESDRIAALQPRADADRTEIQDRFRSYQDTGGLTQDQIDRLRATGYDSPSGSSSGGGGGGGGGTANAASSVNTPDYLNTFRELMNPTGGFDPTRLSGIQGDVASLRNARGNYGATERSVAGLEGIGHTGGITDADTANINRDSLTEIERTGGYDEAAKQSIRNRANRAGAANYAALQDEMARTRSRNPYSLGLGGANFRLAREGAQQAGQAASDAEIGIQSDITKNRLAAGSDLSTANLGLTTLRTGNQIAGYRDAAAADTAEQRAIQDATSQAGTLDLNTQDLINRTRGSAAEGTSRDTLGRLQIDAQERVGSGANAAMSDYLNRRLRSENETTIMTLGQRGRQFGDSGLLDTYGTAPAELTNDQNRLFNYRSTLGSELGGLAGTQAGMANASGANRSNLWSSAAGVGGNLLNYFGAGRGDTPTGPAQGYAQNQGEFRRDQYPQEGNDTFAPDAGSPTNPGGTTDSNWYPTPTGPNGPDDGSDDNQTYGNNERRLRYV